MFTGKYRGCLLFVVLLFMKIEGAHCLSHYDHTVLSDSPVGYWPLEPTTPNDYSGHNMHGVFTNNPSETSMPNNDIATVFNGQNQYFTIPDDDYLEITRTGILTITAWFRPDTLQFSNSEGSGYVLWMGKGQSNEQSWAARIYNYHNAEDRPNRISGYVFNKNGGLGAGSYFQDPIIAGQWIYYALTINTVHTSTAYPTGYTKIFRNGTRRDQDSLSSYSIIPENGAAPMRLATRQMQSFFKGAIGKVAVFDYELSIAQLQSHFSCMIQSTGCIIS